MVFHYFSKNKKKKFLSNFKTLNFENKLKIFGEICFCPHIAESANIANLFLKNTSGDIGPPPDRRPCIKPPHS
jgi:hypothetical protein